MPLFYQSVVPLNRENHRHLRVVQPASFGFARIAHIIPAVVDEFAAACRHLPIVFLPERSGPMPVFLTGFQPDRSMLVNESGAWLGRYLPAYLRRYPFIIGEVPDADPIVCLDETAEALDTSGATHTGLPLFGPEGSDTPLLTERIELARSYAESAERTSAFGQILQELGLLRPVTIQWRDLSSGETHALQGALGVDEPALTELSDAEFSRLRREGWLAPLYAHLVSLQTVSDFTTTYVANGMVAGDSGSKDDDNTAQLH